MARKIVFVGGESPDVPEPDCFTKYDEILSKMHKCKIDILSFFGTFFTFKILKQAEHSVNVLHALNFE